MTWSPPSAPQQESGPKPSTGTQRAHRPGRRAPRCQSGTGKRKKWKCRFQRAAVCRAVAVKPRTWLRLNIDRKEMACHARRMWALNHWEIFASLPLMTGSGRKRIDCCGNIPAKSCRSNRMGANVPNVGWNTGARVGRGNIGNRPPTHAVKDDPNRVAIHNYPVMDKACPRSHSLPNRIFC